VEVPVTLDSRTARFGLGAIALARCGIGVVALVAPGAVRLSLGGSEPGTRTRLLARFAGGRDLALGGAVLAALATGESVGVTALAGVAVDASDAVSSLIASRHWPARRWLPSAASAIGSAVVGGALVERARRG
jgi:hypothetical protein